MRTHRLGRDVTRDSLKVIEEAAEPRWESTSSGFPGGHAVFRSLISPGEELLLEKEIKQAWITGITLALCVCASDNRIPALNIFYLSLQTMGSNLIN